MKYSNFFIATQKDVTQEAKLISHSLMLRSGMIKQEASGIYSWMPIGFRVLKKISKIIELMHDENEINQILMPTIQSSDIWKISERYNSYGKEMLKISDRHNKELLYGPTNEEMITTIGKYFLKSYKDLPVNLYHIQSKFRDEIRPRFGVMRAREFLMKDAYSFDLTEEESKNTYIKYFRLYLKIFKKLGLPIVPVRAPSGEIGGNLSHEFHLLVESGESDILINESLLDKNFEDYEDKELFNLDSFTSDFGDISSSKETLVKKKSIELGHIFSFGQKYSKSFDLKIDTSNGKVYPFMGSYGIGISRIPAAAIEYSNDDKGIIWPSMLAPFMINIINLVFNEKKCCDFSNKLLKNLTERNIEVLLDDREERPGKKFTDSDLLGIPFKVVVGKSFLNDNKIGIIPRVSDKEELVDSFNVEKFILNLVNKT